MALLSIKLNTWCIDESDINISNYDIEKIKELLTNYISNLNREKAPTDILRAVLKNYFNVSKISICTNNHFFLELINYIRRNEAQRKFALVCLDADTERIVLRTKYFVFSDDVINIENLKEQIKKYVADNPKNVNIRNIIFNSLEILSEHKVNKKVTKYYKDGIIDRCIENPLYTKLFEFVQNLSEYKENLENRKKSSSLLQSQEKLARKIQKETEFLDRKFEYLETHVNKHFSYNTRYL